MPDDVLRVRNLRFFAYHGVFPEEQTLGQFFEVDLEIHGDLAEAGQSDDPTQALNYVHLCQLVEQAVTGRRFNLVEALAEHIAQTIGAAFPPIEVTVRVRKPHPPVQAHFDGIEVEMHRRYA